MSDQTYFIVLISVAVLLPVIPSVILFKFLPADANVEGPFKGMKTKFGGAFAGYFVILILVGGLIEAKRPVAAFAPYEVWHVTGQALLGNSDQLLPTDITVNPPNVSISRGGTFYLDIPVTRKEGNILNFPTLSVSHRGYNTVDIPLGDPAPTVFGRLPVEVHRDPASRSIRIATISLGPMAPYNPGGRP